MSDSPAHRDASDWLHILESDILRVDAAEVEALRQRILTRLHERELSLAEALREVSDETLAVAIQKSVFAVEAFEELLAHRYLPQMLPRWLTRWGASADQADDVAQELTLRFWNTRLGHYQPTRSFSAYCYRAARYRWIDAIKRHKRIEVALTHRSEIEPPREADPVAEAIGQELLDRVVAYLPSLPRDQASIVRHLLAGSTPVEIAVTLQIDMARVYRELYAARRNLEALLRRSPPIEPG